MLLEGGSDTSAAFLKSLVLCLVAFPETLHKAQKEIDDVVGNYRTPSLEDAQSVPYIQAIMKEVRLRIANTSEPSQMPWA